MLARLLVPLAALSLAGCADDAPDQAVPATVPSAATVRIERSRFSETELTVAAGTTVVFVNDDAFAHTVTSRDGAPVAFDSGDLGQGDTFEVTFDRAGTYPYLCLIHPTMRAVVVVT
jgi:plastocyanin